MTADLFGETDPANDPVRLAWRRLVEQTLPGLAAERRGPIRHDHCFARVLLDNAVGQPWRGVIAPPAWRNTPQPILRRAICLGERLIADKEDCAALNRASLEMHGKTAFS